MDHERGRMNQDTQPRAATPDGPRPPIHQGPGTERGSPACDLPREFVRHEWARMLGSPVGLPRPLLVLGGWRAPWMPALLLARHLRKLTGAPPGQVLAVSYPFAGAIEPAAAKVILKVQHRWPPDRTQDTYTGDADRTTEVDVVGISMGGLVARLAAAGPEDDPGACRLAVARLFTLASPHRGAKLAGVVTIDRAGRSMRPGSGFLGRLDHARSNGRNARDTGYELIPYARLRDWLVGARQAAPHGMHPIWVSGPAVTSHHTVSLDHRIIVDIARRLRGEPPVLSAPCQPPRD